MGRSSAVVGGRSAVARTGAVVAKDVRGTRRDVRGTRRARTEPATAAAPLPPLGGVTLSEEEWKLLSSGHLPLRCACSQEKWQRNSAFHRPTIRALNAPFPPTCGACAPGVFDMSPRKKHISAEIS